MAIDEGTYGNRDGRTYLAWFDDEGEEGAAIGQDGRTAIEELKAKMEEAIGDDREYLAVELAAKRFAEEYDLDHDPMRGWITKSKTTFKKYKAAMIAAVALATVEPQVERVTSPTARAYDYLACVRVMNLIDNTREARHEAAIAWKECREYALGIWATLEPEGRAIIDIRFRPGAEEGP